MTLSVTGIPTPTALIPALFRRTVPGRGPLDPSAGPGHRLDRPQRRGKTAGGSPAGRASRPLLRRAADADLLTLMLGGNDLLQGPPLPLRTPPLGWMPALTALLTSAPLPLCCWSRPPPLCLGAWTNAALCPYGCPPDLLLRGLGSEAGGGLRRCRGLGWSCSLTGSTSPPEGHRALPWASKRRWNRWPPSSLGG